MRGGPLNSADLHLLSRSERVVAVGFSLTQNPSPMLVLSRARTGQHQTKGPRAPLAYLGVNLTNITAEDIIESTAVVEDVPFWHHHLGRQGRQGLLHEGDRAQSPQDDAAQTSTR